ncbi:MAG TPA: TylF/MycF/NovP-related O-methyltransferase [Chitinophagaceae bacterium]
MVKMIAKGINYLLGKSLSRNNVTISASLDYLQRERNIDKNYFDSIRLSTLELICFEINKKQLEGNAAELGVYKGKFARYINSFLPGRKLYLFDTFEGFDPRDVSGEQKQNLSSASQDFSDTSVAGVLRQMPFPDQCIPVKGFFPESAAHIEDRFVLVSLDADLYHPIYAGLQYFYPRLVAGGYILVHDFNNDSYKGARKAVEQFCQEAHVGFVPLPDSGGSAIITK